MMREKNKAYLQGNIGTDIEFLQLDGGLSAVRFRFATNERWKDSNGEEKELTTWHNVKAWGKTAELIFERLKKGSRILIEGKIRNDVYEKDGESRTFSYILCQSFLEIGQAKREDGWSKPPEDIKTSPPPKAQADTPDLSSIPGMDDDEDDLPF